MVIRVTELMLHSLERIISRTREAARAKETAAIQLSLPSISSRQPTQPAVDPRAGDGIVVENLCPVGLSFGQAGTEECIDLPVGARRDYFWLGAPALCPSLQRRLRVAFGGSLAKSPAEVDAVQAMLSIIIQCEHICLQITLQRAT